MLLAGQRSPFEEFVPLRPWPLFTSKDVSASVKQGWGRQRSEATLHGLLHIPTSSLEFTAPLAIGGSSNA